LIDYSALYCVSKRAPCDNLQVGVIRFLAKVNVFHVRYVVVCPSVCLSSVVGNVRAPQPVKIFGAVSTPFGTFAIRWPRPLQVKFYGDRPRATPPVEGVNAREVAADIAILDLSKARPIGNGAR